MNSSLCVLEGDHISGGKLDAFIIIFVCVLCDFLGGEFGILEEGIPRQEIAGINTASGNNAIG